MHKEFLVTTDLPKAERRAAARRRRLHHGVELWNLDLQLSGERPARAVLLTFTITGDWQAEAQNRMRRFWNDVRNTWYGARYFCWAELTAAGQLHYQAWWVNPPHEKRVNLIAWVKKHWGDDRTNVRFPRKRLTDTSMLEYVRKYVYKMGKKSYQQRYSTMPSDFRTFMTQRTDVPPAILKDHVDRDDWEFIGQHLELDREKRGASVLVPARLVCRGRLQHVVPYGASCSAILHRRPRARPRRAWHRPPPGAPGGNDSVVKRRL